MPWVNATELPFVTLSINNVSGVSVERGHLVGKSARIIDPGEGFLLNFGYSAAGGQPYVKGIKYRVDYWLERCDDPAATIITSRVAFPRLLDVQENLNGPPPAPSFVPAQGRAGSNPSGQATLCLFGLAFASGITPVYTDFSITIFFLVEPPPIPGVEPKVVKRNTNFLNACDISDTWSRCK